MNKSGFVPKIVIAVIFLVVALIISIPVFSVAFNRFLGGGIIDFNNAEVLKMWEDRPIEGQVYDIVGCIGESLGDDDTTTTSSFQKGSYYYLVQLGTSYKDEPIKLMIVKTEASSEAFEQFNSLWRELSAAKGSQSIATSGIELSGVLKDNPEQAQECIDGYCKTNKISNYEIVPYMIDCTSSVSAICLRFYISLAFYLGFIICVYIIVRTIKKNRDYEYSLHRRAVTQSMQDVRSGANQPDGSDSMFGDSESMYSPKSNAPQYQSQQTQQRTPAQQSVHSQQSTQPQQGYQSQQSTQPQQGYQYQQSAQPQQGYQYQQSAQPQRGYQYQQSAQPQQDAQADVWSQSPYVSTQQNSYDDEGFFGS